jgi:spermidine synthase
MSAPAETLRRGWWPSGRSEWTLVLAGANLMLLNFLLVQHTTVAFRHDEIAVIVFSLAYFLGVSLGYQFSDRLSANFVRWALPVCLTVQMGLFIGAQALFHQVSVAAGRFAAGGALLALIAAFATSVHAVFLPRVIAAGGGLRRCYSLEIAGSLLGLALVPLLAPIAHECVLAAYFVSYAGLAAAAGAGRWLVGAIALGAAVFVAQFGAWDRAAAGWFDARFYHWQIDEVALARYTPYHKIEVVRSGRDYRLLLNGKRQFGGDPQRTYAYFVAEVPARLLGAPKTAVLGCGSMATVGRIGDFVPQVRIVDIDPEVFRAARKYFAAFNRLDELHNWTFEADDAKHWIANAREQFGLILHDIPPARSRQVALTYTEEFFRLAKARLEPGGIFSISSLTPLAGRSSYGRRMLATLGKVFEHYVVLVHGGSAYFYGGGPGMKEPDGAEIQRLLAAAGRDGVRVYTRAEIEEMVRGETIITMSNVGDLIYE